MKVVPHRVRLVSVVAGLLALAGVLGVQSSRAAEPSLTLNVNLNGSLEAVLGNGTRIRTTSAPGTVIPPGSYLLIVRSDVPDDKDIFHLFHISGAGVNVSSDLLPCENPRELYVVTLRPNAVYTYEDIRHPELARVVFSTSGEGSSAETSSTAAGPATGKLSGSVANSSPIGSGIKAAPFRGTLIGTVGPGGKLTLSHKGKSVSSLKSGRYTIAVEDKTPEGGFMIERPNKKPVALTGSSFIGKHAVTVNLNAGKWMFYSAAAKKHGFTVVG
jgi:hypothetical protein